ncbi:MAG: glycosyltransferase [Actinobacteria bacterium]|nr:MAG: glycosyltransferase [Actinomycetota bacterium]
MTDARLRILFAAPVWWPSHAFGGPVTAARELVRGLVARGHDVEVVTSSILGLHERPVARSRREIVDGADVRYLATPLRYRWMGITPTLPATLARAPRPDVVHVFGFRDPVTTATAAWCRIRGIPYVFEPLGMFTPRVRKLRLKRVLDPTLYRGVATAAAAVVVASERERDAVVAAGIAASRVRVRGNGFPSPPPSTAADGTARGRLGVPAGAPLVLYVGRVAAGKGLEHLAAAAEELPDAHVVVVGPDDRHGTAAVLGRSPRVHVLPPTEEPPFDLYRAADVFVLPSEGESFGLVAAEAAAVGTPVVVTDRCGVAGFFEEGEALVVQATRASVVDAVRRVLTDQDLAARLREGGTAAARRMSWDHVVEVQEQIYFEAAARTAATNASTLAS